jgi:hypothetical protein
MFLFQSDNPPFLLRNSLFAFELSLASFNQLLRASAQEKATPQPRVQSDLGRVEDPGSNQGFQN